MTQTKQATAETPATDDSTENNEVTALAQALLDKKAAIATSRSQPPFPKPRALNKGKKIGNSPRGTRQSMGKR